MIATQNAPKRVKDRVSRIQRLPLDPLEFCRRWCELSEGERGYKTACAAMLARIAKVNVRSAERWVSNPDTCPDTVRALLRREDILNQIRVLLRSLDEIEE